MLAKKYFNSTKVFSEIAVKNKEENKQEKEHKQDKDYKKADIYFKKDNKLLIPSAIILSTITGVILIVLIRSLGKKPKDEKKEIVDKDGSLTSTTSTIQDDNDGTLSVNSSHSDDKHQNKSTNHNNSVQNKNDSLYNNSSNKNQILQNALIEGDNDNLSKSDPKSPNKSIDYNDTSDQGKNDSLYNDSSNENQILQNALIEGDNDNLSNSDPKSPNKSIDYNDTSDQGKNDSLCDNDNLSNSDPKSPNKSANYNNIGSRSENDLLCDNGNSNKNPAFQNSPTGTKTEEYCQSTLHLNPQEEKFNTLVKKFISLKNSLHNSLKYVENILTKSIKTCSYLNTNNTTPKAIKDFLEQVTSEDTQTHFLIYDIYNELHQKSKHYFSINEYYKNNIEKYNYSTPLEQKIDSTDINQQINELEHKIQELNEKIKTFSVLKAEVETKNNTIEAIKSLYEKLKNIRLNMTKKNKGNTSNLFKFKNMIKSFVFDNLHENETHKEMQKTQELCTVEQLNQLLHDNNVNIYVNGKKCFVCLDNDNNT